ncbi:MAG: MOSC domain-containing protein [Pirellulales bacterium]|nr:MOSC domain-containing protein [Pirellulales bacterium]
MLPKGRILSIQVGRTRQYHGACDEGGTEMKPWASAIAKDTIRGPIELTTLGLTGDEQADLIHHGGLDKAVLAYGASHYEVWKNDLPSAPFAYGAFGENLTVTHLDEANLCVGDVVAIGGCRLQVSQPRQPCWKLSRRWSIPELSGLVQKTGRTGWYLRVLTLGSLEAGMEMEVLDRPHPEFTLALANDIMHKRVQDRKQEAALAACPALSESWRETLHARIERASAAQY